MIVCMIRRSSGILLEMNYSTDLFNASTIEQMARHYATLLGAVCSSPNKELGQLDIMSEQDRQLTLQAFNATAAPYPADLAVHQLFEQATADSPEACCLITATTGDQLSYAAVNAAANQLAHWLISNGTSRDVAVAVSLPKCPQLVIALLAVLKAGGCYVPLDPELPAERAAFILKQTGAQLLLASPTVPLAGVLDTRTVLLTESWEQFADCSSSNPAPRAGPSNLAHITFTSGSTGVPKVALVAFGLSYNQQQHCLCTHVGREL